PAPAKTTEPGKSLAPVRLMVLPAVTVKVAGPAPLRWVIADVELMFPVAAVALKVPRPRSHVPRVRAVPLTTATGWVDYVALRLTTPPRLLPALVSAMAKWHRIVTWEFAHPTVQAAVCVHSPPSCTVKLPVIVYAGVAAHLWSKNRVRLRTSLAVVRGVPVGGRALSKTLRMDTSRTSPPLISAIVIGPAIRLPGLARVMLRLAPVSTVRETGP